MSALALALGEGVATIIIKEWLAWTEKRQREANYRYTPADIEAFLSEIAADTPEAIRAEIRAELAKTAGKGGT